MLKFQNKNVLITGASAGIGAALAREFVKEGAKVILLARRIERLKTLTTELNQTGEKAFYFQCDVTDFNALCSAVQSVRKTVGPIDVVIANAGFGVAGTFEKLSLDDYTRQFEVNVFGVLKTVKATLSDLKETRGILVIVGSVLGYLSLSGNSPYSMSKFSVRALSMSLREEFGPYGIGVTHIAPGMVQTEIRMVNNQGVFDAKAKDPVPSWIIMPAQKAARIILKTAYKRKREAIVTGHGKGVVWLVRHFPWFILGLIHLMGVSSRKEPQA